MVSERVDFFDRAWILKQKRVLNNRLVNKFNSLHVLTSALSGVDSSLSRGKR